MQRMELPKGVIVTVIFDEIDRRTRLTLRISHRTAEDRKKHKDMGVVAGWHSTLDCMEKYLATLQR